MKITVTGDGSTYTSEVINGFARLREVLRIEELWLLIRMRIASSWSPGSRDACLPTPGIRG